MERSPSGRGVTPRLLRLLANAVGVALIVLVLWLVGLGDRVVDEEGVEHAGRVLSRTSTSVLLRTERGEERIPIEDDRSVHLGLLSTFESLSERPGHALAGLALHVAAIVVILLRWFLLLKGASLATPWPTVLRVGWIGQFFGNVLPGGIAGGDVVKALYIARRHAGRAARAVVTIVADRALGLVLLCAIAFAAALLAPEGSVIAGAKHLVILIALCGALLLVLFFSARLRAVLRLPDVLSRLPFQGAVGEIRQALAIYAYRPKTLVPAALAALLGHGLILAAFVFYGRALGGWLSMDAVLVAIPVAQILAAIPGLPGGWGVGDLAFFLCLPAVGVPPGQAVALSVTYRIAHTVISLPAGLMLVRARRKEEKTPP